jgi:hypothetical protein
MTWAILVAALAAPAGRPAPARADGPRLLLSWGEPWGTPGASDHLVSACDDTAGVDTLYLSFQADRSYLNVTGMEAVLFFHPTAGDTLQDFWFFKHGWANQGNLVVQFDNRMGFPCTLPWVKTGTGHVSYDHRSGRGRLDLAFEVPPDPGRGVDPRFTYCVGRVMILHRRNDLAGCRQSVCVEWASLRLHPRGGHEVEITDGERFVTWGPDTLGACGHLGPRPPEVWRPDVPVGETPAARKRLPTSPDSTAGPG